MATHPKQDPLDEEIERVLRENPGLRERLAEYDRKREAGELTLIPHEVAMRRLGLDRRTD